MAWSPETNIKGPKGDKGDKGDQGDPGAPGSGSGDVVGPAGATPDDIAVFSGSTGKIIKDGGKKISDLATIASVASTYVAKAGDSMTGNLTIDKTAGGSSVVMLNGQNAASGGGAVIVQKGGASQWLEGSVSAIAAGTSNDWGLYSVGISNFPLVVSYATGNASFGYNVTVNGALTVGSTVIATGGADPQVVMNKTAGSHANIIFSQVGGLPRWAILFGNYDAESGSNAGSNFGLYRYTDAGTYIDTVLTVYRNTGVFDFLQGITSRGPIVCEGQAYSPLTTLTDGATISAWDCSQGQKAKVTLGAAGRTMPAVTNAVEGATYYLWLITGVANASITTWASSGNGSFDFGAAGAPVISTSAARADLLTFEALNIGGTIKLRYTGIARGFS